MDHSLWFLFFFSTFWNPGHCTVLFSFLIIHSSLLLSVFMDLLTTVECSRDMYIQLVIFSHKDVTISTTTHISSLDLLEFQIYISICLFDMLRLSLADISDLYVPIPISYLPLESQIVQNPSEFHHSHWHLSSHAVCQLLNSENSELSHTSFCYIQNLMDQ